MSAKNTWFDDPDWDDLRKKTNKKGKGSNQDITPVRRQAQPPTGGVPQPRPMNPSFLKQPTAEDLRRAMSGRSAQKPTATPQRSVAPIRSQTRPASKQPADKPFIKLAKPTAQPQADAFDKPRDNRPVEVSIHLSLPTMDVFEPVTKYFKRAKQAVGHFRFTPKQLKLAGALVVVLIAGFASTKVYSYIRKNHGSQVLSTNTAKPTYAVTKPDAVNETEQVKFDPAKQVASYGDKVDDISIVVSQQPLPDSFKSDPFGQLEKLATSFSATESFVVGDFKVYIGVSAKGPQSLILIKDKKLIFIQSQSKIPNADWIKYIETMKTS